MQTFSAFLAMNSPTLTRFSKRLFGDEFADFNEISTFVEAPPECSL